MKIKNNFLIFICLISMNSIVGLPIFDDGTGRANYYDLITRYRKALQESEKSPDRRYILEAAATLDAIDKAIVTAEVEKLGYLKQYLSKEGFYPKDKIDKEKARFEFLQGEEKFEKKEEKEIKFIGGEEKKGRERGMSPAELAALKKQLDQSIQAIKGNADLIEKHEKTRDHLRYQVASAKQTNEILRQQLLALQKAAGNIPAIPMDAILKKPKIESKEHQYAEFLLNVNPGNIELMRPSLSGQALDFPAQIPLFGKYFSSEPYYLLNPYLAIIQNKTESLKKTPAALTDALKKELNIDNLDNILKNIKINFFTIIAGELGFKMLVEDKEQKQKLDSKIRNALFHSAVAAWARTVTKESVEEMRKNEPDRDLKVLIGQRPGDLYVLIKMGIFNSDGVVSKPGKSRPGSAEQKEGWNDGINIDRFGYQIVNLHQEINQLRYSPDTAQFQLARNRELVSFWIAAISHDKKTVNIAFVVMIDSENINKQIEVIAQKASNLGELLQALERVKIDNASDAAALRNAIQTIRNLII